MKKQEKRVLPYVSSFSIDHWKDDEPVSKSHLDNPIFGAVVMVCSSLCLIAWASLANNRGNSNRPGFAEGVPVPMMPSPEGPMPERDRAYESAQADLPPWSTTDETGGDRRRTSADVSVLIDELIESDQGGRSGYEIKQELSRNGCHDTDLVRRLSQKLRSTSDARQFEKINLIISGISYVVSSNPDIKTQFIDGLTSAGKHIRATQLKGMDRRVPSLILEFAQLPESEDLLSKLASLDPSWGQRVLTKLGRIKSNLAAEASIRIVRDYDLDPRNLLAKDSEIVCRFLWEGKLAGKTKFANVDVGTGSASIKAFEKAALTKLNRDPEKTIDALVVANSKRQLTGISKNSLSKALNLKLDTALSTNVDRHFAGIGGKGFSKVEKRNGPDAFLDLAKQLGDRKTAIAIAKSGKSKPEILKQFPSIRDILLAFNEPETYDAIAVATGYHGNGRSKVIQENMGQAIEPSFLRCLRAELKARPDQRDQNEWVRRMIHLVEMIDQVGSSQSVPALQELAKTDNGLLRGMADRTLKRLRQRSAKSGSPAGSEKGPASEEGPVKVSTDSGEAFRSSVDNIVQGKIPRSRIEDRLAFDPENMWHSDKLERGWATIELKFPKPITLDKIQIYSQHTGKNHLVTAAKVYSVGGGAAELLCDAVDLKQFDSLQFKSTTSRKWKLELKAGESNKVVVRGLRFFDGERELYRPLEIPAGEE